jgi:hypothetical protein
MADIPVGDEKREPADAALAVPQLGETRLPAAFDERRAFLVGDLETSARDYRQESRASEAALPLRCASLGRSCVEDEQKRGSERAI